MSKKLKMSKYNYTAFDENGNLMNFSNQDIPQDEPSTTQPEDNEPGLITMPEDIVLTPVTPMIIFLLAQA